MREDIKHAIDLSIFPPDLAEVIAAHAAMFGATRMEVDTPPAEATPEQAQDAGQQKDTFRPIASQDELDRIVTARLSRERAKYADYDEKSQKAAQYDQMQESAKTEAQKQQERLDTMSNDNLAAGPGAARSRRCPTGTCSPPTCPATANAPRFRGPDRPRPLTTSPAPSGNVPSAAVRTSSDSPSAGTRRCSCSNSTPTSS